MKYKKDDIVRIVRCDSGNMVEAYAGSEATVLEARPTEPLPLYVVEVDVGRAIPNRPRFIVREDMIEPDVTKAMLAAGDAVVEEIWRRNPGMADFGEDECLAIYRAMRAARSK